MALSLSFFPVLSALLLALTTYVEAATVTYNWNISWVTANPDNAFDRPTIGINGQWPPPTLYATVNDTVIVNVINQLGNQSTTLHFHGLYQNGTTQMDGPSQVSQCPIPAGSSFTYNFTVSLNLVSNHLERFLISINGNRSNNQEPTGIIPTTKDNIQTD